MSKRRSSERGAGETSGRASKLQCPGISGNNAKRAGPFILGKEAISACTSPKSMEMVLKMSVRLRLVHNFVNMCNPRLQEIRKGVLCVHVRVEGCLCVYARLRQECEEFS